MYNLYKTNWQLIMVTKRCVDLERRVDLSISATKRVLFYKNIISAQTDELTPQSCLKVLKYVYEVRNKALQ